MPAWALAALSAIVPTLVSLLNQLWGEELLKRVIYRSTRQLAQKTENKIDDELAEVMKKQWKIEE